MIPKIRKGKGFRKLLWYLFGPGDHNEHTDPHLVAGFADPAVLEPPRGSSGRADIRWLAGVLESSLTVARDAGRDIPDQWVWHCSLSLSPDEGTLPGERWREIATAFVEEMGFAGCPWVAVRHGLSAGGGDHIHVVASRFDLAGDRVSWHLDFLRAQQIARGLERRFGLREVAVRDGTTSRPETTHAEAAIARRRVRPVPDRVRLRREVRAAVAAATSELEMVRGLRARGVLVRARMDAADSSRVTGWAVALPPDNDDQDQGVTWFGGAKLSGDLSLAKLRARWGGGVASVGEWEQAIIAEPEPKATRPAGGWWSAASVAASAARDIGGLDAVPGDVDVVAVAAVDVVARLAVVAEPGLYGPVSRAVDALSRAAVPARGQPPGGGSARARAVAAGLRAVSGVVGGVARPGGGDTLAGLLAVVAELARLADAIARLREAQGRRASAGAALSAQRHLAEVLRVAAARGVAPTGSGRVPAAGGPAREPAPGVGRGGIVSRPGRDPDPGRGGSGQDQPDRGEGRE